VQADAQEKELVKEGCRCGATSRGDDASDLQSAQAGREYAGLLKQERPPPWHIGVLVTKDSGKAGGVAQKLEAARIANCEVVVVARPASDAEWGPVWFDIPGLVDAISELLASRSSGRETLDE
jgi:hypothetical protein